MHFHQWKRREFITLLGGAAAWPLAAKAQQGERMRRIGVLMNLTAEDSESQARNAAFLQALGQLGWTDGRNVRIEYRWAAADPERFRTYATELVASAPDVLVAYATPAAAALQQATRTLPIVFASVIDPVGANVVESLSHPGGNVTGFTLFEYSISAKWLELLKELAPNLTRAAVVRDAAIAAGIGQFAAIQTVAPSLGVELSAVNVRDKSEIERALATFVRRGNGGLIVTASPLATTHRDLIIELAGRQRLPAVYPFRYYVNGGGLMSYGPDQNDQFRRAATYVDRILRGEKPADLPVQAPVKYELVINLKTAKALGLEVPPTLLARADEVIE
jgi:putative tryptophan/tyrosine transport system substrate-binding protein